MSAQFTTNRFVVLVVAMLMAAVVMTACKEVKLPEKVNIKNVAQNPEGIEYNKNDRTFFLSSLNAAPIIKVKPDGTFRPFTSGEKFPLSTAGLQIDYERNRLLVASFNGAELMDKDPKTKGVAHLRIYNLKTGVLEKDINLSSLVPKAKAYFANDIAVDKSGNVYISDWYAGVVYKYDTKGKTSVFWTNTTGIKSGPNGLDFHPDGYLLVSILTVNKKGLYANFGLVKIPVNAPKSATLVRLLGSGFTGFDGMVVAPTGKVLGVTNNGKSPGGNTLVELSSKDGWQSATITHSKSISPSTTVALTPKGKSYVIHQDFSPQAGKKKNWTIQQISF